MYACAFLELAVELNSFSLGRVLPPRGFSCRVKYFAVGYLPDPACDDALDSDPVDPEFVAFPPEFVEPEPEPELFALLEFEFVLSPEVWPEPEPLGDVVAACGARVLRSRIRVAGVCTRFGCG